MPLGVPDPTYKLSCQLYLVSSSLTPKLSDKVHLIVNQNEIIVFALNFPFFFFTVVLSGFVFAIYLLRERHWQLQGHHVLTDMPGYALLTS